MALPPAAIRTDWGALTTIGALRAIVAENILSVGATRRDGRREAAWAVLGACGLAGYPESVCAQLGGLVVVLALWCQG